MIAQIDTLLAKPAIPGRDTPFSDGEHFDPWELFPALYGSYSSAFDELAIDVLCDIRDGTHKRADLAAQMFREMLCTSDLCEYGTSPRVCFATTEFQARLPLLIERWREYAALQWAK